MDFTAHVVAKMTSKHKDRLVKYIRWTPYQIKKAKVWDGKGIDVEETPSRLKVIFGTTVEEPDAHNGYKAFVIQWQYSTNRPASKTSKVCGQRQKAGQHSPSVPPADNPAQ